MAKIELPEESKKLLMSILAAIDGCSKQTKAVNISCQMRDKYNKVNILVSTDGLNTQQIFKSLHEGK